jgi:hypothetical protein
MSSKSSGKGRIFLFLFGIIFGSAGGYFLNWIYPFENLVGPSPWADDTITPTNGLIQTQKVQSTTSASIEGTDVTETLIPQMEINLTIQADSTIELIFVASYFVSLFADYQYGAEFNVSLLVDGNSVMRSTIFVYRTSILTETEYEGGNLAMNIMIPQMTAGEHSFQVVYRSLLSKNYCRLNLRPTGYNFTRYLIVNEWSL